VAAVEVLSVPAALDLRQERAFQERFERRVEALRRLHHTRIAPVLAWGEDESQPYVLLRFIVLPFFDGQTLADRLASGPIPLADVASIAAQLAGALDYAHEANVTHGAIAAAHILLDGVGHACLTGFDIDSAPEILPPALAEAIPPTPALATKVARITDSAIAAGRATDIRALASLLYQMATGRTPFGGGTTQGASMGGPEPLTLPHVLRSDLPASAEAAIMRGLAPGAGQPFASAGELARSFVAGLEGRCEAEPPASGVADEPTLERQPTAPLMALAPERPTAPLTTVPPRTGQLVWARRPRPRWLVVAAVAVVVLFALALALVIGVGNARPSGAPAHAPGASTTHGATGPTVTLTPTTIP
jgi:eukaryotic-like serine/threonine-protein kinase